MTSTTVRAAPRGRFVRGLAVQLRVIGAILIRELNARFGRDNIGYLWIVGEPMMLATVITLVHVNQPTHFATDIQPAPFAIIGYTIFIIFRGVFNGAEGAIEANGSLLYHAPVSIFDIMAGRAIVEMVGCISTTFILLTIAIIFHYGELPFRPLHLLAAIGLMCWWSFALALIAASVTYQSHTLGRNMHVLSYFIIPISGAFWQMEWLPAGFRNILQWFPMPLILEQARYGQFRTATDLYVSPGYVAAVCAGLTYLGLILIRRLRSRVHAG